MAKTFRERLQTKIKKKSFIGREAELALFKSLLEQDEPEYLILLVHGIGGVGKTWLLNQWHSLATEKGFPVAKVNDEQTSVEQMLKKFRDDLVNKKFQFDEFDKNYQRFRQLKSEAEKALSQWEDEQETSMAQTAGRFTGKSVAVISKLFTPSKEALELIGGSERVEHLFAEGFGYLRKKFKSKEDLEFLENPLLHLTCSFVLDLNRICKTKRVVLFWDTYEYLAPFSDEWLCRTFLSEKLSDQVMFVFGGRDIFSSYWLDFQPLARQIPLDVFTDEEARTYLSSWGVTDSRMVDEVLNLSGNLPVYLAMLTMQTTHSVQISDIPSATVVERFLQWIPKSESNKRRAVICCAFPRFFNKDILLGLVSSGSSSIDSIQVLFDWLCKQPFISHQQQKWVYHKLVRQQILQYKWQESEQESKEVHEKALKYYRHHPGNETMSEELYHLLNVDTEQGIAFGLAGIFQAWVDKKSWEKWVAKADKDIRQVENEHNEKNRWSSKWEKCLQYILQHSLKSENILEQLRNNEILSISAKIGVHITLGILFVGQKRFEEAEQAYNKAIELNPDYAIAYYNLGNLLVGQKRFEEAEQVYNKAIELNPDYATAYGNLGILLVDQKQFKEAEQAYNKAIELNPDYATAYGNLGILLVDQKRFEEAEQAYNKAIELNPDYATTYYNLGNLLVGQKRFEEAEQAYNKAIEFNPDDTTAYGNLGNLLVDQKRFEEAEQAYNKAIELNPDYATAYYNLGNLLVGQKRFEEAEQAYNKAIELNPDYATTYYNLGNLLVDQKRFEEAEQVYNKAIELNPDYATAYGNLGLFLVGQKRFEEAEQAYNKAIELNPDDATAYGNLGNLLVDQKRFEEAEQAYNKAIELNPDYATAYGNLGLFLVGQKRFEEAEQAYNKAIELNPDYVRAFYNRACLYAVQNKPKLSLADLSCSFELTQAANDTHLIELAKTDIDFDNIRSTSEFKTLLSQFLVW